MMKLQSIFRIRMRTSLHTCKYMKKHGHIQVGMEITGKLAERHLIFDIRFYSALSYNIIF